MFVVAVIVAVGVVVVAVVLVIANQEIHIFLPPLPRSKPTNCAREEKPKNKFQFSKDS